MSRNDIERFFELDLDNLRNRVCELASQLGRELNDAQAGWIGAASKRQLLIEVMWMLANAR
jgi:hypothetical protein